MTCSGESRCTAAVKAQISPLFWGRLFQFAGQMKLLSPDWVVQAYRARAQPVNG